MLKYEKIADDLLKAIRKGQYSPGEQLPLEKELCEKYQVSRITIKKAMDELVQQGLVTKRRGSGTFVKTLEENYAKRLSLGTSNQFSGFKQTYPGKKVKTKVLRFEIVHPSEKVASKLQMSTKDFVYDIIRVRFLEDSIYQHIEKTLKLNIQSAHRTIRAVRSTELEQAELCIPPEMPILEIEQVAFFSDGHPFEYSISHHRADKSEFSAISIR